MNQITAPHFIDWFLDMLQQNNNERELFIEAINNPDQEHARSVFIHGFHTQWKFDAAGELNGSLIISNVPELADKVIDAVREKFVTAES